MATAEFLSKRVEGKKKEIAKLEKQIIGINKAKATGWVKNPYYYSEDDLVRAERYLAKAKRELEDYENELQIASARENSRNIKIINDFLDRWEENAVEFFTEEKAKYDIAYQQELDREREYCEWYNKLAYRSSVEERKAKAKEDREARHKFSSEWAYIRQFYHGGLSWEETMRKDVHEERNHKYDNLVKRVCDIVGEITDVSYLHIGHNGDLNGVIIGKNGKAKVNTIDAGGYNIQCYHFRCLVHKI